MDEYVKKTVKRQILRGDLPKANKVVLELAKVIKSEWRSMILASKPSWWGRMAIFDGSGGGGGSKK